MKSLRQFSSSNQTAFTLIELSIVLVIIGLLFGGFLVGKDLIRAAEIRSQVSQIEKLQMAVHTFRLKFNCLPGDCQNPGQFGFFSSGMTGGKGRGDNDGLLKAQNDVDRDRDNNGNYHYMAGEGLVFFRHLTDAAMIEGEYGASLASGGYVPIDQTTEQANLWVPAAKLGRGMSVIAYVNGGVNYFQIFKLMSNGSSTSILTTGGYSNSPGLTPVEAFAIDSKIDDGLPLAGKMFERANNGGWLGRPSTTNNMCNYAHTAPVSYDLGGRGPGYNPDGHTPACVMSIVMN